MASQNKVQIILEVDDKGSVHIKDFEKQTGTAIKKIEETTTTSTGRMSSAWDSLKSSWLAVTGVAVTVGYAIKKLIDLGEEYVQRNFQMRATFGDNADAMIGKAKELSEKVNNYYSFREVEYAFIKTSDSMQRYGIVGENYIGLVNRAMDIGVSKGLDLRESIDRLESAMRGEAEASEYLGVTLNDTYMKNMAFEGSLKDVWEKLSDNDKAFFRYNELLEQTQKYSGKATEATDTLTGSSKSLWNMITDKLSPALHVINDMLATMAYGVKSALGDKTPFQEYAHNLAVVDKELERLRDRVDTLKKQPWIFGPTESQINETTVRIRSLEEKRRQIIQDYAAIRDKEEAEAAKKKEEREKEFNERKAKAIKEANAKELEEENKKNEKLRQERQKLSDELDRSLMNEKERAIDAMNEKVEAFRIAGLNEVKIEEYIEQEKLAINQKYTGLTQQEYDKLVKHWRDANKHKTELLGKSIDEEFKEIETAVNQQESLYRDLFYKTGQYAKQYTYLRELQIDIEVDKLREQGIDEITLAIYKNEQLRQIHLETSKAMLQYSNNFVRGWKTGLDEMLAKQYTWGQAGHDVFKTFTDSEKAMFSSMFRDVFTGNLKSFGDYWESFWDSMLGKFADVLAEMLVQWIMHQVKLAAMQYIPGFGTWVGGGGGGTNVGVNIGQQVGTQAAYNYLAGAGTSGMLTAGESSALASSELAWAESMRAGGMEVGATATGSGALLAGLGIMAAAAAAHRLAVMALEYSIDPDAYIENTPAEARQNAENMLLALKTEVARGGIAAEDALRQLQGMPDTLVAIGSYLGTPYSVSVPRGDIPSIGDMSYHTGGIIRAHQGLFLGADERVIIGQTGEGMLPRPSMSKLGMGNFEALRTGNFEVEKGGRSGASATLNFHIEIKALDPDEIDEVRIERLVRRKIIPAMDSYYRNQPWRAQ